MSNTINAQLITKVIQDNTAEQFYLVYLADRDIAVIITKDDVTNYRVVWDVTMPDEYNLEVIDDNYCVYTRINAPQVEAQEVKAIDPIDPKDIVSAVFNNQTDTYELTVMYQGTHVFVSSDDYINYQNVFYTIASNQFELTESLQTLTFFERVAPKTKPTAFTRWLDTFVDEKGLDLMHNFEVETSNGLNIIECAIVIDAIKNAPHHEQQAIKTMIVKIDFYNGDVMDYLKHLAQALAI